MCWPSHTATTDTPELSISVRIRAGFIAASRNVGMLLEDSLRELLIILRTDRLGRQRLADVPQATAEDRDHHGCARIVPLR